MAEPTLKTLKQTTLTAMDSKISKNGVKCFLLYHLIVFLIVTIVFFFINIIFDFCTIYLQCDYFMGRYIPNIRM